MVGGSPLESVKFLLIKSARWQTRGRAWRHSNVYADDRRCYFRLWSAPDVVLDTNVATGCYVLYRTASLLTHVESRRKLSIIRWLFRKFSLFSARDSHVAERERAHESYPQGAQKLLYGPQRPL